MGKTIRCLTRDATVMAMAMDATDIVAQAEKIHETSAVITAALGRTLTAASMMGILLKGRDDTVTLKLAGGGPVGHRQSRQRARLRRPPGGGNSAQTERQTRRRRRDRH